MTQDINWKDYEVLISQHFNRLFPDASIQHDVKRVGVISKIERQIDILIEGRVAGFQLTIVVDCKYFGKKVDVKDVDEFLGYLHDLRASKGVLITNQGYTEAAYNRAMYDTRDVELRIVGADDLETYQSLLAIVYFGAHGAIISAPDGWLIDATPPSPQLAAFYPMGLSRAKAFDADGYIYVAYSKKDAHWPTLDHLLDMQLRGIKQHYRNPRVGYEALQLRDDCNTRLRHLETAELAPRTETTLFLDFPEVIVYLNLLSPTAKQAEYVKKLKWIAEKLIKAKVIYGPNNKPVSVLNDND